MNKLDMLMIRAILVLLLYLPFIAKANDPHLEFRVTVNFIEETDSKQTAVAQEVEALHQLTLNYLEEHADITVKNYSQALLKANRKGKIGNNKIDVLGFNSYWDANDFKKYLRKNNYQSAWMVSYFKSTRIAMADALSGTYDGYKEQKEKPQYDEQGIYFRVSLDVLKHLSTTKLTKKQFVDKLYQDLLAYPDVALYPKATKSRHLKKSINRADKLSFVILPLRSSDYSEIDALKKYLRSKGYQSSFLLAYKNGIRTPIKDIAEEPGW